VFNHLLADLLIADPHAEGGERVLFYSGDDARAKGEVATLIGRLGFAGVDLGTLAVGGKADPVPRRPLAGHQLRQVRLNDLNLPA
jgi:predicted dinucleotide-binding enzyme